MNDYFDNDLRPKIRDNPQGLLITCPLAILFSIVPYMAARRRPSALMAEGRASNQAPLASTNDPVNIHQNMDRESAVDSMREEIRTTNRRRLESVTC